ncbi:hypothetical protein ACIA5C_21835 [Actinoplanes sp. NPDC051343]|uniref:hypothetical protein n=1 Tax=Actinoplanes sp. NPDC051343 TaxID=3363906 RepID=UPI00378D1374
MIASISLSDIIVSVIGALGAVAAAIIQHWISKRPPPTASGAQPSSLTVTRRRYLVAWRLVAALSLVVAVLAAMQVYQGLTRQPVTVEIRTPTENEPVDGQRYGGLEATVNSVPPGFEITIVVYDTNSHRYNPSDKLCDLQRANHLKCTDIYLGKDGTLTKAQNFVIEIVGITADAKKDFEAYNRTAVEQKYPGLVTLPAGVLIIGERGVVRRS